MALYMGDISDLYDRKDVKHDIDNASGVNAVEETRVGTQASFEQLLERELAKEHARSSANGDGGLRRRSAVSGSKPRQSFLRKGSRGWWMENPEAKRKMQKHTLTSVATQDSTTMRPATRAQKKPLASRASTGREERSLNGWDVSPQNTSPAAAARAVDLVPMQLPLPVAQWQDQGQEARHALPQWASALDWNRKNARESVDTTLGMSAVRQQYEAQIEQEADELAEFEALERELAAEKASYLREKHEATQHRPFTRSVSGLDEEEKEEDAHDDASWLRESSAGTSSVRGLRRPSHSSVDLGGDSSLVFDGDHHHALFQSPLRVRGSSQRPSFASSSISALSVNESEPWGDATHAMDHFARLAESPIATRGSPSVLLQAHSDAEQALSIASSGHYESLWTATGENQERMEHDGLFHHVDDYNASTRHAASAPVSSLVRRVFSRGNQWEAENHNDDDDDDDNDDNAARAAPSTRKEVAQANGSVKAAKAKASTHAKPSGSFKKATSREQAASQEPKPVARRRSRGFSAAGTLPLAVEEKLAELEEEVRFYKSETLQLQKKKAHFDDELQRLTRQKEAFVAYADEQRRLIEQAWEHERQKMRKEERLFERQVKLKLSAAASAASRKDRAEIDALKAQIVKLQLDAKQASAKSKSTNDALRQRIAELEGQNRELSEEIKFLEKDRLSQWQKYEELVQELHAHKQKATNEDGLKTVQDVAHISRSAEQLMHSLGLQAGSASPSSPNEYLSSVTSTPTYAHEDSYNPGRYRNGLSFVRESQDPSLRAEQRQDRPTDKQPMEPPARTTNNNHDDVCESASAQAASEVVHPGGKREITYSDGTKKIYFADGNEKEIQADGHVLIRFTNGDRKEFSPSTGISVYHYCEAQTKLTTYPDKTKVYEFPNQQTETSYPDGRTEIQFADGIQKIIYPNGDEVSTFPDGTTMFEDKDGLRQVTLLNGKQVRYYANGSMALVGEDGHETQVRSDEELKELMESL